MHPAALWTAVFGLGAFVAALDPVEAYGNKFFTRNGTQFFVKGELYDRRAIDTFCCTNVDQVLLTNLCLMIRS